MTVLTKDSVIKIGDTLYMATNTFNFDLVATSITEQCVEEYGFSCNDDIIQNMIERGMLKQLNIDYIVTGNFTGIKLKENKSFLFGE